MSSSSPTHTGYGGGIGITIKRTYGSSFQTIDLKGMKIYGNSA
jgi:hypothetical protein